MSATYVIESVGDAILTSHREDRIVTIDYTPHRAAYLRRRAEGSAAGDTRLEYWGRYLTGHWRVHLRLTDEQRELLK
jgi:hypothetical protein